MLGPGTVVGNDADGAGLGVVRGDHVEARARVVGSILGHAVHVGADANVQRSILAEGAVVPPGAAARDMKVPPFTVLES